MAKANPLTAFSEGLRNLVATTSGALVRVEDGSRLTATGLVWEEGLILTTSHGTERDDDLTIVSGDGARYPAALLGRDPDTDLAALQVEAPGLPTIARRDLAPEVGEVALAIGRPGDTGLLATLGLVASVQLTQTGGHPEWIVSTDADLYPGISGGALVDTEGRLIGLLNRLYGRGTGIALGAPLLERVTGSLRAHGRVPRGYLGIRSQLVTLPDSLRVAHGLAQERGLLIVQVEPGNAAEAIGFTLGDTLLAIDSAPIQDTEDLRQHLVAGKRSTFDLLRGGVRATLTGTVGAAPA